MISKSVCFVSLTILASPPSAQCSGGVGAAFASIVPYTPRTDIVCPGDVNVGKPQEKDKVVPQFVKETQTEIIGKCWFKNR